MDGVTAPTGSNARAALIMRSRRLLTYPAVMAAAILLVGAIVQTGRTARNERASMRTQFHAWSVEPAATMRSLELDGIIAAASTCQTELGCTRAGRVTQLTNAADRLEVDAAELRYVPVYQAAALQLRAQAALITAGGANEPRGRGAAFEVIALQLRLLDARVAAGMISLDDRADARARTLADARSLTTPAR